MAPPVKADFSSFQVTKLITHGRVAGTSKMSTITVYSFRVRDERSRKWRRARYKMTREHARVVYGERNYELILDSAEERQAISESLRCPRRAGVWRPTEQDGQTATLGSAPAAR